MNLPNEIIIHMLSYTMPYDIRHFVMTSTSNYITIYNFYKLMFPTYLKSIKCYYRFHYESKWNMLYNKNIWNIKTEICYLYKRGDGDYLKKLFLDELNSRTIVYRKHLSCICEVFTKIGDLAFLVWLYRTYPEGFGNSFALCMVDAAISDDVRILKWLYDNFGHIDVLKIIGNNQMIKNECLNVYEYISNTIRVQRLISDRKRRSESYCSGEIILDLLLRDV